MFDNGNLNNLDYSRGLIYKLNTVNKTATVIKDFTHPQNISSNIMGNMQYLENNNMIIGWGGNENGYVLTEFSQTGEPIFDLIISNNFENYRAFRYPWKTTKFNSDIDSLNFGSVDYTNDSIIVVKITNNSEKMMELSGFSTSDTVFTVTNDFPLNINSNDFVELNIKFKPNKLGDNYEDILTINSDNYKNELFERIAIQINLHGYSPDIFPPEFISYPQDGSLDVSVDSTIIIKFNESIRFITNNEITNRNIQSFLKLRKGSLEGEVVDVAVIINEDKNEVTIKPKTHLECSENYYIVIENMIEDYNDNAFSETFFGFRTSNVSGVITNLENEIVLFPNPTKDLIKIKFNKKPQILKISNMNGELVYIDTKVQELNNYKVDFSDKNNGIYLVFILFDDGSINMSKFVKNE
jgi:hypothetical protein